MTAHFGAARAASIAHDHVFSAVGGRTIDTALAGGVDPRTLWLLVCDTFDVPEKLRFGLPDE